jgi:superfamily II DNA or RNA helicase
MISALIIARRTSEDGWDGVAIGLYLGGMKQRDLNVSAAQRIIIATYIMAEEAFDCPSLNTLILTTPKKNIVQSIGRIMRKTKTERSHVPLIIDIMDEFSNFYNWNRIRLTTYRKHRYLIENYEVAQDDASPEIQTITQKPTIYANTAASAASAAATAEVDATGHSKRACGAADSDDDDEYDC